MKHGERLLWEMEKRGGAITSNEMNELRPHMQYNRVIHGLRKKGYIIRCEDNLNQPNNSIFRLISRPDVIKKPQPAWSGRGNQLNLFEGAA